MPSTLTQERVEGMLPQALGYGCAHCVSFSKVRISVCLGLKGFCRGGRHTLTPGQWPMVARHLQKPLKDTSEWVSYKHQLSWQCSLLVLHAHYLHLGWLDIWTAFLKDFVIDVIWTFFVCLWQFSDHVIRHPSNILIKLPLLPLC